LKGGLIIVGDLNLGGGLDPVYNAVNVAELAIEEGEGTLLIPISARRQLDEMAMKISILFCADGREALIKALTSNIMYSSDGTIRVVLIYEEDLQADASEELTDRFNKLKLFIIDILKEFFGIMSTHHRSDEIT
jgi:hypothetical protein